MRELCRAGKATPVAFLVLAALVLFGAVSISHRSPSPVRYAKKALSILENGYYAHGDDWEVAKASVLKSAAEANAPEDLYVPLFEATRVAGGKHSSFQTPEKMSEFHAMSAAEFEPPRVTTHKNMTVVRISTLGAVSESEQQQYVDETVRQINQAAPHTCGWIVDLRDNRGGNMWPMLSAASPLLPNGPAMSFTDSRGRSTSVTIESTGAALQGKVITKAPTVKKVTGMPIAVLQGQHTASSGEAVLLSFTGSSKVRTFGEPSAGYSSANAVHPLPDGAWIVLTEATYTDRTGSNTGEEPLPPDVWSSPSEAFDEAVKWLSNEGCA